MLAARCTQNAKGKALKRPRFGAQLAQALIELRGGAIYVSYGNIMDLWQ